MSRLLRLLAFVLLGCGVLGLARADDVPGRVGRLAFVQGDVQAYAESDPTWRAAYVNQPLTSRNSIFVGDGGRAELTVGSSTFALDGGTQIDIQQLDDERFAVDVVRGRVSATVRRIDADDRYELAVRGADFTLLQPGRYRIDALDDRAGLTVFGGQATVRADGQDMTVNTGSAISAMRDSANPDLLQFTASPAASLGIDDWLATREARFRDSQTARYVSPGTTGYEDLDANGRWANEPDVGPVWYPTTYVSNDWVPYRYGRWAWVPPWGWTWVDDAPWGFAPFHYGRWLQVGNRWGWTPGAYVARPVYAPALVGFYGGNNVSVSFSVGAGPAVGWYPLAPWQRYAPQYTRNVTYINRVNNITIVNPPPRWAGRGDDRDWNRFHGSTVVPQNAFASQRPIGRVAMAAPHDFVQRGAPVDVGALPRPAGFPSASLRQGPRPGDGSPRPQFRDPREFAGGPDRAPQPEAARLAPRPGDAATIDRARQDAERRERFARQPQGVADLPNPNGPRTFGSPDRPADAAGVVGAPRFEPRRAVVPQERDVNALQRQREAQADADRARMEQFRQQAERRNEGMRTEMRNMQRPPQPVQPVEAPAALAPRHVQPQMDRPQMARPPQPVERPQPAQRMERPMPSPAMQQKLDNAGIERGGPGRDR